MAVLADFEIKRLCAEIGLISPFDERLLQPASYDVTLGKEFIVTGSHDRVYTAKNEVTATYGDFVLATTQQTFNIPDNLAATLALKSSIGRRGMSHALACWADPGFEGEMTMELYVIGREPITLRTGMPIAQMIFMPTVALISRSCSPEDSEGLTHEIIQQSVEKPYAGRYQNQRGPTRPIYCDGE